MLYRTLSLSVALVLALAVVASARPDKDDKDSGKGKGNTHSGKFVSAKGQHQFVMTDRDGKEKHTHTLADNAKITCDGKECKLSDLKEGTMIRVTTSDKEGKKVVTRIQATTKAAAGSGSGKRRNDKEKDR